MWHGIGRDPADAGEATTREADGSTEAGASTPAAAAPAAAAAAAAAAAVVAGGKKDEASKDKKVNRHDATFYHLFCSTLSSSGDSGWIIRVGWYCM